MRADDLIFQYVVNNWLLGEEPPAFDILAWNVDSTNLPAAFDRDMLEIYADNRAATPGAITVQGTPVDLTKVDCDNFVVAGLTDHITPWKPCYMTSQVLGGESEMVVTSTGHIQSIVNPPGKPRAMLLGWARARTRPGRVDGGRTAARGLLVATVGGMDQRPLGSAEERSEGARERRASAGRSRAGTLCPRVAPGPAPGDAVLVHGSPARVDDVAAAVERAGFTALHANTVDDIAGVVGGEGDGNERASLDGYIQLPVEIAFPEGAGPIEQFQQFLSDGLLARIDAARVVVPALAKGAGVVLAAGNAPDADSTPDNRAARRLLLGVLQRAILDAAGPAGVDVTVLDVGANSDEVVAALGELIENRTGPAAAIAEADPEASYKDWFLEMLSRTGSPGASVEW